MMVAACQVPDIQRDALIDPSGAVVAQVPLLTTGVLVAELPLTSAWRSQ